MTQASNIPKATNGATQKPDGYDVQIEARIEKLKQKRKKATLFFKLLIK